MKRFLVLLLSMPFGPVMAANRPPVDDTASQVQAKLEAVHPLWLRERCTADFYADPSTLQPRYNLHQEVPDLTLTTLEYEPSEPPQSGSFHITFSDQRTCVLHVDTLAAELDNDPNSFLQATDWGLVPTFYWDKTLMAPPHFQHDDIVHEGQHRREFLSRLISTGIALVSGVPREEGECARFGQRFSTLRETEWGTVFNVRSSPDSVAGTAKQDLAYTSQPIGMHIDNAYRIGGPPDYQLLHAIEHCQAGIGTGCQVHNQFVDGFAAARDLCESDRPSFDILTSVVLRWENNGGDGNSLLYRYAPMIELQPSNNYDGDKSNNACPQVSAINFSAKSGGYTPHLPYDDSELFYRAKRKFSSMLHSEEYIITLQLYPGALIFFDNRRVLHSRSTIAPTDGARWLQGCYVNRDGIHMNYEKLRRSLQQTVTPFTSLREGTRADFDRMGEEYDKAVVQKTMDNLLSLLQDQSDKFLGQPVSLAEHNIQTASRALRAGEDDETVVMSLFHDVFETLAVKNHGELASSMLAPWISPRNQWLLAHHEIFQGYFYFDHYDGMDKNKRDMFLHEQPGYYNWTSYWCEHYDQTSFDPDYPSLPLDVFLPIVQRVLSRPSYWWNPGHPKAGAISNNSNNNNNGTESMVAARRDVCTDTWTCYNTNMVEPLS